MITGKIKISPQTERLLNNSKRYSEDAIERGMEIITDQSVKQTKDKITELGLVGSGKLRKSVNGQLKNKSKSIVGASQWYAHLIEDGTKSHTIPKKVHKRRKKAIFWPGASHPVRVVEHPGTKAYRFLGGTIEEMEQKGELESFFARGVNEIMQKIGVVNG